MFQPQRYCFCSCSLPSLDLPVSLLSFLCLQIFFTWLALKIKYHNLTEAFPVWIGSHYPQVPFYHIVLLSIHPVVSESLWPHGLQHARAPCLSPSPGVCASSCPLHQWYHPAISFSDALFSFCPQSSPAAGSFPELAVLIRWPKYWSFSISPLSENSGLISFKIDWFDLPWCPRDSQESSPAPQFEGINSLALCLLYSPALTKICDHWKDKSLANRDLLSAKWCLCFSTHYLGLSLFSFQETVIFCFHGFSHHPQQF